MDDMERLERFANKCIGFEKRFKGEMSNSVRDMRKLLDQIKNGNYGIFGRMRDLTYNYAMRKRTAQKLKESGDYLGSITVSNANIGFKVWTRLSLLARYLEFGTKNMKPIPHWRYIRIYGKMLMRRSVLQTTQWLIA